MHEQQKIDEAGYFLNRMQVVTNEPAAFRHEFSAFLSAARSALQYALAEAETKPRGQHWFDTQVATRPFIRFFKDKRDTNIHEKPVPPVTNADIGVHEHLGISEQVTIQVVRDDGTVEPPRAEGAERTERAERDRAERNGTAIGPNAFCRNALRSGPASGVPGRGVPSTSGSSSAAS